MSARVSGGDTTAADSPAARPYRSHKVPACDRCRKRKIRCIVEVPGQSCLLCRFGNKQCIKTKKVDRPAKRQRIAPTPQASNKAISAGGPHLSAENARNHVRTSGESRIEKEERGAMIVGPAAAEDIHIIEEYMTSKRPLEEVGDGTYNVISNDPAKPILYLSVPARRKGLRQSGESPGSSQREIMDQILGPLAPSLTVVYFEHIHPWFPMLDASQQNYPHALKCDLYATSLIYWSQSAQLKIHPRPDPAYAWNLAVAALQEEFLSPSLSTLYAALLDLNGRPVTSITDNVLTCGKTVALAQCLGLNRDPSSWNIPKDEKHARIRLWWGILIHDRWSSFAHGIPATIARDQYDVPEPDIAVLRLNSSKHKQHGTDCFFALCNLTEILADILPLVYNLQAQRYKDSPRKLRRVQIQLDDWQEALPDWLKMSIEEASEPQAGACNLQLSLLAVKMLLCRIALRDVIKSQGTEDRESKNYHQSELRKSAQAIVSFVCSLQRSHLHEFWLPYCAYHINSASIVLLRCAIDTTHLDIVNTCRNSLQELMTRLHQAKETDGWDLGDICIAQCKDSVTAITAAHDMLKISEGQVLEPTETGESLTEALEPGTPNFLPMQNNWERADDLQYPWANLWDMLEPQGSMY